MEFFFFNFLMKGFIMVILTIPASLFVGVILDRYRYFIATTLLFEIISALSLCALLLVMYVVPSSTIWLFLICSVLGFSCACVPVSCFETASEHVALPQSQTGTGLTACAQFFGIVSQVGLGYLDPQQASHMMLMTGVFLLMNLGSVAAMSTVRMLKNHNGGDLGGGSISSPTEDRSSSLDHSSEAFHSPVLSSVHQYKQLN